MSTKCACWPCGHRLYLYRVNIPERNIAIISETRQDPQYKFFNQFLYREIYVSRFYTWACGVLLPKITMFFPESIGQKISVGL